MTDAGQAAMDGAELPNNKDQDDDTPRINHKQETTNKEIRKYRTVDEESYQFVRTRVAALSRQHNFLAENSVTTATMDFDKF